MEKNGIHKNHLTVGESAKVVIVGAGIAGLTAAIKLIHNGLKDVILLEAQDYIGGRVKGQMVDDKMLDMGPMFIHGQHGNPMYDIAKVVGSIIEDGHGEDILNRPKFFFTSRREKVPFEEIADLIDFMEHSLDDLECCLQEGVSRGSLITTFYQQFLRDHNVADMNQMQKELYDAAYRWFLFYEGLNEGVDNLDDVSAWAGEEFIQFKGNYFTRLVGGYSTIIEAMVDLIPAGVIRLKMSVAHIDWSNNDGEKILVTCNDGDIIATDHVITTMSVGCLKNLHSSIFDPPLPQPFVKTIQKLELGGGGKIFLKWDIPFWSSDVHSYEFLCLDSAPLKIQSDKSMRKTSKGTFWWSDIAGVETVSSHENILLIWLLPHQLEVIKDIGDEEIKAILHELLQLFFYDTSVPEPVSIYRTTWLENSHIQGGYTHPTASFLFSDVDHLETPIPSLQNPRLLFAGEAFSLKYMTATHGAFITGEKQAENVLHANGITNCLTVVETITEKHSRL